MKKKNRNRLVSVLLVMVTVMSLLSGCGRKSTEKRCRNHHRVFMDYKAV